ncbi:hypothetical protein NADFUDRAFT_65406 [Nadsonia fulvescens var. elongata DSM 6958]|uniref:Uncharacterized protein n=1 Tax=Nadsonia fulvescens var. elongata DSM 6958 TaxID=857566 RepID=A0A1E3PL00_9ASCO|nr:hypothetical protein NADFUDRAFT_65406 [Nadsonia fulvescens var. elongata DSM 6958]
MSLSRTAPGYQENYTASKMKRQKRRRDSSVLVQRAALNDFTNHQSNHLNLDNSLRSTTPTKRHTITEYYQFLCRRFYSDRETHYSEIFKTLQDKLTAVEAGQDIEYQEELCDFEELRDRELLEQCLYETFLIGRANKVSQVELDRLDQEQQLVETQVRVKLVKWLERQIKRLSDSRDHFVVNNESSTILLAGFGDLDMSLPEGTSIDTTFAQSLGRGPNGMSARGLGNDSADDNDDPNNEYPSINTDEDNGENSNSDDTETVVEPDLAAHNTESVIKVFEATPPPLLPSPSPQPLPLLVGKKRRGRPASAASLAKRALELNGNSASPIPTTTTINISPTVSNQSVAQPPAVRRSTRGNPNLSHDSNLAFSTLDSIKSYRKKKNRVSAAAAAATVSSVYTSTTIPHTAAQDGIYSGNEPQFDLTLTPFSTKSGIAGRNLNQLSDDDLRYVLSDMDITPYSGAASDGRNNHYDRGYNSGSNGTASSVLGNNYGAGRGKSVARLNSLKAEEIQLDLQILKHH